MRVRLALLVVLLTSTALAADPEPPGTAPAADPQPPGTAPAEASPPVAEPQPATPPAGPAQPAPPVPAHPAPGPPPPALPPPMPPPQYARRSVELIPHLGLAFPHCQAGSSSDRRCSGVAGGIDLGFGALWRVSPHFAAGGALHLAPLRNEPDDPTLKDAAAFGVFLGLIGRVYFLDDGRLDPYVELGIGGALLGTEASSEQPGGPDRTLTETGAGPALQIGGGLDFILTRGLRLGPMISYTRAFVDKIRSCPDDDDDACSDVSKDDGGYLDSFLTVGARLTIMVGQEL